MANVKISVSVDDEHIDQIADVSQQLQSAGMTVESTLPLVGIISGFTDSDNVDALSKCEGVHHVEAEQTFQLAPPESDVQ